MLTVYSADFSVSTASHHHQLSTLIVCLTWKQVNKNNFVKCFFSPVICVRNVQTGSTESVLQSQRSDIVLTCWHYSQILEHSWEGREPDPASSCLCEHKRKGKGLPLCRKNGFLNHISGGKAPNIHSWATGRVNVHIKSAGSFPKTSHRVNPGSFPLIIAF